MLSLLAEIYQQMPEKGDADQPEVIFIDVSFDFNEASTIIRANRNYSQIDTFERKWNLLYHQNPMDIPSEYSAQLGLKIQHAESFYSNDPAIKQTLITIPLLFYKTDEVITSLGIEKHLLPL
jgi:hypothetical protein